MQVEKSCKDCRHKGICNIWVGINITLLTEKFSDNIKDTFEKTSFVIAEHCIFFKELLKENKNNGK